MLSKNNYQNVLTSAVSTHISIQKSTKTVDLENITKGNLAERVNNLMSDGKVINKTNHSKDSCLINLDLINTVTESGLNISHGVIPNTANAPISTYYLHPKIIQNQPLMHQRRTLTLLQKLLKV